MAGLVISGFGEALAANQWEVPPSTLVPSPELEKELPNVPQDKDIAFSWNNPLHELELRIAQKKKTARSPIEFAAVQNLAAKVEAARVLERSYAPQLDPQERQILEKVERQINQQIESTDKLQVVVDDLETLERRLRRTVYAMRQAGPEFDSQVMSEMASRRNQWADELRDLRETANILRSYPDDLVQAANFSSRYQLLTKKITVLEKVEARLGQAQQQLAMTNVTIEGLKATSTKMPPEVVRRWVELSDRYAPVIEDITEGLPNIEKLFEHDGQSEEAGAIIDARIDEWTRAIDALKHDALRDSARATLYCRAQSACDLLKTLQANDSPKLTNAVTRLGNLSDTAEQAWTRGKVFKHEERQILEQVGTLGPLIDLTELYDMARRHAKSLKGDSEHKELFEGWQMLAQRIQDHLEHPTPQAIVDLRNEVRTLLNSTTAAYQARESAEKRSASAKFNQVHDMLARGIATSTADAERIGVGVLAEIFDFDAQLVGSYFPVEEFEAWVISNHPGSDDPDIMQSFLLTKLPWIAGSFIAISVMAVAAAKIGFAVGATQIGGAVRASSLPSTIKWISRNRLGTPVVSSLLATGLQRWGTSYREAIERGDSNYDALWTGLGASWFGTSPPWYLPLPLMAAVAFPPMVVVPLSMIERGYGGYVHSERFTRNGHELREVIQALNESPWANLPNIGGK